MTEKREFDLVVIGGGPAGEKGAVQAAYFGKRVLVVEAAREPGGAAVHTGTLPSKTLRETALFLSGHRQSELYGLRVELDRAHAVPKLLARKDAVSEIEVRRIRWNLERHGVELLEGRARLGGPNLVWVKTLSGERAITADHVLIATGSSPHHPADIPFDDPDVDDSDTILTLDRMPNHLVVLGAGVIGCEYACMFAAMGSLVTLIDARPGLLPFLDAEVSERLRGAMLGLGMRVLLGAKTKRVVRQSTRQSTRIEVEVETSSGEGEMLTPDRVLATLGRQGNTTGLGLEDAGVEVNKRGCVVVDANFRTRVPSVWAAGDVVGFPALASISMEQARVAVCHAFGIPYKRGVSALYPYGIYTIPEVSSVGLSEGDAAEQGRAIVVGRALFRDNARGKILGDRDGFLKLIFDANTRVLIGCHCMGDRASELVHIGQAVIALSGTVDTLIDMVFNYPTLSEAYKYAAYDALGAFGKG